MSESTGTSLADAYAILKEYYDGQPVDYAVARNNPLFAMVEKDTQTAGRIYPQPLALGGSQDYVSFSTAQTNQIPVQNVSFQVPMLAHYAPATVQNIAIQASRNDKGAFVKVLKQATDVAMANSILSDAWSLYRSGSGAIGVQSGSISSGVLTLSNPTDAMAFQKGMVLTATASDGTTARAGVGYVLGVSVSTGKILISDVGQGGAVGTPSGWVTTDILYPQGNLNGQINGLSGWFPLAGASNRPVLGTAKTFLGVDRSVDPDRTCGFSADYSGEDIEAALIDLVSNVRAIGRGQPDYVWVNQISYQALTKALQARRSYTDASVTSDAGITFRGCLVDGAMVIQDPSCPPRTAFATDMSTLKLISFGKNPDFIEYPDGLSAFRVTSTGDAVEARLGGYRNLVCSDPSKCGSAVLPV